MKEPSALRATISGRVQMVMMRDFVRRKARALGLVGEVENLADGTVRVYAEGSQDSLEKFVPLLKKGPVLARVDEVQVHYTTPQGTYSDFKIIYD